MHKIGQLMLHSPLHRFVLDSTKWIVDEFIWRKCCFKDFKNQKQIMKFSEVSALILSEGFKFLFKFINKAQGTFSDDAGN